ncbi:myo-inositol 2-dehydrogenase/D-chiro-inositol 1-dehydrogenase [Pseudochelatococcus lubricantis]|uniref:Myo-inositol 2-dehydrogenase/D-chiro-inositol 1-dehydrogenase n=1 Tax=Pseudochelatococcus lubricantis TaxID=1538102 RepID=A0ABX0V158_9HYPH|nr:inositol 2-dehydrogenase [Pseudochelatococcus lubricantis]NIJ58025.1 myo-inositol 2-dehydrogenase/D-chiro-inositol 1-dehydrogenase [Pseudochelatococcus lubricantis]
MVRIAVLGAGRIGRIHARNVAENPAATLVAIADPFGTAAADLAAQLSSEASLDPVETIERADVDAVVIGTPTDTHVDLLLHAVRRGKAVLCEKPIDLDLARVDEAVAEIARLDGRVMLAFNRRFDPSARELRNAIDAGEIGEVRQVVISSRDPGLPPASYLGSSGGIFRDMTIHDFDMARWFLGEEPVEISAIGSRVVDRALMETADDYDTVMVQMRTASGRQCHINNCREAVYGYDQRFEIFGSQGALFNDNLRPTTVRRWTREATDAREPLLNFFLERYADAYKGEMAAFVDALANSKPMPVGPHDGRQALLLADRALESLLTGKTVAL